MSGLSVLSYVCAFVLLGAFTLKPQPRTEAPSLTSTTIPEFGVANRLPDPNEALLPLDNPLAEGMSFEGLRDLINAVAGPDRTTVRGAREIAVYRQAAPAVVLLKTKESSGSGVVLQDGRVLTNRHVVEGIGAVGIFFKPNDLTDMRREIETRPGTVQFVDRQRDLAVIAPQSLPPNYKFLKIAPYDDFEVGADVYAIGHPLGYSWTFTHAIITALPPLKPQAAPYPPI